MKQIPIRTRKFHTEIVNLFLEVLKETYILFHQKTYGLFKD